MIILGLILIWAIGSTITAIKQDLSNTKYLERVKRQTGKDITRISIIVSNIIIYAIITLVFIFLELIISYAFGDMLNITDNLLLFNLRN